MIWPGASPAKKSCWTEQRFPKPLGHLRENTLNAHFPLVNKCDNSDLPETHETQVSRVVSHFFCCNLLHGKPLVLAPVWW